MLPCRFRAESRELVAQEIDWGEDAEDKSVVLRIDGPFGAPAEAVPGASARGRRLLGSARVHGESFGCFSRVSPGKSKTILGTAERSP